MRVYGTRVRVEPVTEAIDLVLGYPSKGIIRGATGKLTLSADPGIGWTLRYAMLEQADDGLWEYPVDVPAKVAALIVGLPQRKHKDPPLSLAVAATLED